MRALSRSLISATLFLSAASQAALTDQHSIEAIEQAIASPIPDVAIQEARKYDDQILQTGTWDGMKVYLVTDDRARHAQQLVARLLGAMGENQAGWVVRILDTDPKLANAFVAGGKYVYIFTGLIDQARSDDELAFVVGHELGHSLLKHNLRQHNDLTSTLANLAIIVAAAASSGGTQHNALAMSQALHNSYSQIDEREADTFGVIASWRAGFDPLRGADFFSRQAREQDKATEERDRKLDEYRAAVLKLGAECQALKQQWANGQADQSQENADIINQRCAAAEQQALAYNAALAQSQSDDTSRQLAKLTSDHPDSQERIAAIAALTDYVRGVRPIDSLGAHAQAQRVITALLQKDSALLKPPTVAAHLEEAKTAASTHANSDEIATKMQKLKDMYQSGLIEKEDYDKKKQELLGQL